MAINGSANVLSGGRSAKSAARRKWMYGRAGITSACFREIMNGVSCITSMAKSGLLENPEFFRLPYCLGNLAGHEGIPFGSNTLETY